MFSCTHSLRSTCWAVLVALLVGRATATPDPAALNERIDQLTAELAALKAEVQQLKSSSAAGRSTGPAAANAAGISNPEAAAEPSSQIGGYGELTYAAYAHDSSRNVADLRRFVLLVGHQFDDQLSFNSELEVEHAVSSADDQGEVEVEQAFLDYRLASGVTFRGGLFLIPLGLLNESHEPPAFYGVNRNEVETRIIPTTWREGGFGVRGSSDLGFDYSFGITTGFDTTKLDDAGAPLAASHQELQLARARDLSIYGALNYRGTPGLLIGAGVFTGNSTQGNAAFKADRSRPDFSGAAGRVTLWDAHARWQSERWDLAALYAVGTVADTARIDATLAAYNATAGVDRPFVPSRFDGWYLQAAYRVWDQGGRSLAPFVRYEYFDTQAAMPAGFDRDPANRDHLVTAGFSFRLHPQVVMKADYQKYQQNTDLDAFNFGLGFMF